MLKIHIVRAEDAVVATASSDAVVSGSAFHWMDANVVSRLVRSWLKPSGFFFVFGVPSTPGSLHIVPEQALDPIRAEAPKWEAYKSKPVLNWVPYVERVRSTNVFAVTEPWQGKIVVRWTPVEMAGYFLSSSFASMYARTQSEISDYLELLTERIVSAVGAEVIEARFTLEGAIAFSEPVQEYWASTTSF